MPEVGTVPLAPEDVAQQYEKQQRRVRLIASAQEQLQAKEESGGEKAPSTTTKSGFRSLLGKLGLVRRTSSATSSTTSSNNNNAVKQANSSNDNVVSNDIKRKLLKLMAQLLINTRYVVFDSTIRSTTVCATG